MLEVRDLTVRYGALCVVDSVSFSVQPGEWLMIAGPNGAGKSTVLNAVAQATPYTGQVLLNNRDARRIRRMAMGRVYAGSVLAAGDEADNETDVSMVAVQC